MIVIFISTITVSIVKLATPGRINCKESLLGHDWAIFITLGIVQSILIIVSSIYLTKIKNKRQNSLIDENDINHQRISVSQMKQTINDSRP